jgi:hypothetical protein
LKRVLLVLTVALVMVAMLLATAVPAFALRQVPINPGNACTGIGTADTHGANPRNALFCT